MPDANASHDPRPPAASGSGLTPISGSPDRASTPGSPFALLEAERQRLEQFTREQLAQISRARELFLTERRAAEQALEERRQQLEQQGQLLRSRLQEVHEQKRPSDRIEDALPERHANYRRRRFSSLIDKRDIQDESADPELHALREQLQEMKQTIVLLRGERDAGWDELQQLRQELRRLQESQPAPAVSSSSAGDQTAPAEQVQEIENLRRQLRDQQQLLQQLQDREARRFPSDEWQRRLDQLKSERDVALAEVRRLVEEPEDWSKQEEEITARNRELARREAKLQDELHLLAQEHQQIEKTRLDSQERIRRLDEERAELDRRDREFHFREEKLRLREAEIKEMRDLIEQDNALARKELVEERREVARLRDLLRQEHHTPYPPAKK